MCLLPMINLRESDCVDLEEFEGKVCVVSFKGFECESEDI